MKVAIEVLERSLRKRTFSIFAPWAWFSWMKWYALAVVLAELCSGHKGPFLENENLVARESFAQYKQFVADTDSGLLWKPIAKLMRRVQRLRDTAIQDKSILASSSPRAVQTWRQHRVQGESGQESLKDFSHNFQHGSEESEPSLHFNSTNGDWIAWNNADETSTDKDDLTINEGFDLEEGNTWFNWDLFLEDINSSTDMT